MLQSHLPATVIQSFDSFLEETGIPRMDAYQTVGSSKGSYMVSDLKQTYIFHDVPLPPPLRDFYPELCKVCGTTEKGWPVFDYVFRFTHNEKTAHTYAVSWTTQRQCDQDVGGNFYISSYGIKVCVATDTIIVWRPKDYHGTSLPCCTPLSADDDVDDFSQVSLALVTSPNLVGLWKRVQDKKITLTQAEALVAEAEH